MGKLSENRRIRILVVLGTRPEAIKLAPIILKLQQNDAFDSLICVTGQHREMLDQVLNLFEIKPDYDLNIMKAGQTLHEVTARVLINIKPIMEKTQPNVVLVQGDTATSFATALSAFYLQIPVAHLEAGLRTGNMAAPFPEEGNRVLISKLADYHFAATGHARKNLLNEGIPSDKIWVVGNSVVDAVHLVKQRLPQEIPTKWKDLFGSAWEPLSQKKPFVLITGHRRENFGQGFQNICTAIQYLAQDYPTWQFVYPVHLNPNVQVPVSESLGQLTNVHLLPPLEYIPFSFLMSQSRFILTDSGGIQEESPSFGKPLLIMRDVTERIEVIEANWAKLVGTNAEKIVNESTLLIEGRSSISNAYGPNPYGDGHTTQQVLSILGKISV